jgi:hypothetical protein
MSRDSGLKVRETQMEKFTPLRENAIVAKPTDLAKTRFIQTLHGSSQFTGTGVS